MPCCLIYQTADTMKNKRILLAFFLVIVAAICKAQDTAVNNAPVYGPNAHQSIQDKLFEFGVPMLFLILLLNIVASVLKNRADHQLKLKMLEKGVSEETLIKIFKESDTVSKLQPLKYFLICVSLGIAFLIIHFTDEQKDYALNQAGYFALGVILLLTSCAFYLYYRILQKKL
jgi:hypothetical protein